jgi:2-polyprenyl-6-methoxyphenol hydroxylase-like FAD-dependent oxidoreductase
MATNEYDAIVIGARCAGSPAAMLLARKGYRVLVVDRATFPSDTISTHILHTPGVAALKRWGLLERLLATGCPPLHTYTFDFGGHFTIAGSPAIPEAAVSYGPRRTVLDKILVDAAAEAGAEVREGFSVESLLIEDGTVKGIRGHSKGGATVTERAKVVVGADGLRSLVARAVSPEQYNEKPPLLCGYYSYWSGLPNNGVFATHDRGDRGFAVLDTHDGLTMIVCGWPFAELEANRDDIEGNVMAALGRVPEFYERVLAARREEPFRGMYVPNYFRKPYGPGWVLVGDAGYNKDFITGQGIQDAFRDAESVANALDETFSGARHFYAAMADYQASRDQHVAAIYELTTMLASMEPPPPEMQQLLAVVSRNPEASDGFVRMVAGAQSPAEFLAPENVARIMSAASPEAAAAY